MKDFSCTPMGRTFFKVTTVNMGRSLERIASSLEKITESIEQSSRNTMPTTKYVEEESDGEENVFLINWATGDTLGCGTESDMRVLAESIGYMNVKFEEENKCDQVTLLKSCNVTVGKRYLLVSGKDNLVLGCGTKKEMKQLAVDLDIMENKEVSMYRETDIETAFLLDF